MTFLRRFLLSLILLVCVPLIHVLLAQAQSPSVVTNVNLSFTTIDVPGAGVTNAYGINTASQFLKAVTYHIGDQPVFVTAGDLNGDGFLDLATSNTSGTSSILLGNGDGTFRRGVKYRGAGGARGIAAADLNRDGKLDLVSTSPGVWVAIGNGDGTFQRAAYYSVGFYSYGLTVADINQ
jgi:hypothetical protein